jgi:hypothetical protein
MHALGENEQMWLPAEIDEPSYKLDSSVCSFHKFPRDEYKADLILAKRLYAPEKG